jgi:hypothetical protein
VRQLTAKLHETGSVADMKRSGRPPITTQDYVLDISDCTLQNPKNSVHKLTQYYCEVIFHPFTSYLNENEIACGYFQQYGATAHTAPLSTTL